MSSSQTHSFDHARHPRSHRPSAKAGRILTGALLLLGLGGSSAFAQEGQGAQPVVPRNLSATFSENPEHEAQLEASLAQFLAQARDGEFPEDLVDPVQLRTNAYFFDNLAGYSVDSRGEERVAQLMKSYCTGGETYRVTLAIFGSRERVPHLYKMVELVAEPHKGGYRFGSPFSANTERFHRTTVGDVTFHYSGEFNPSKALAFVEFRKSLVESTGTQPGPLDYYCFQTLDELLKFYGLVFDRAKCNFLKCDLGFTDNGGARYVTGTGREDYIFGYLGEHLAHHLPNAQDMYRPFVTGLSTYYGGYGLSGEGMDELKAQFRAKLHEERDIDFLEEFKKGRGSSVNRHFSYFVISAFLCEAVMDKAGFAAAQELLYSGADGERFFPLLKKTLGVDESNFHQTVLELIGA
jgi:hypothetical protein